MPGIVPAIDRARTTRIRTFSLRVNSLKQSNSISRGAGKPAKRVWMQVQRPRPPADHSKKTRERGSNTIKVSLVIPSCLLVKNALNLMEQVDLYDAVAGHADPTTPAPVHDTKCSLDLINNEEELHIGEGVQHNNHSEAMKRRADGIRLLTVTLNVNFNVDAEKTLDSRTESCFHKVVAAVGSELAASPVEMTTTSILCMKFHLSPTMKGYVPSHCDGTHGWVVVYSLGPTAHFQVRNATSQVMTVSLESGDCLVFDATEKAMVIHGVKTCQLGTCPQELAKLRPELQTNRIGFQHRFSF